MSLLPISIPQGFRLLVKKGDILSPGQVIANRGEAFLERRIPVATLLDISPKNTGKYLRKNPGDSIKTGEIIARKTSFISIAEVVSKISGTLLRFERESGDIVIEISGKVDEGVSDIISPNTATVTECSDNEVILETKNNGIVGLSGAGDKAEGVLFVLSKDKEALIDGQLISVDMIGNIIMAGMFSREALVKSSGMGVAGVIVSKLDNEDLAFLEGKRMLLPILEVDDKTYQTLALKAGKKVYLDPIAKTVIVSD